MLLMALFLSVAQPPPRPMTVDIIRDAITDTVRAYAVIREDGNRLVVSCNPDKYEGTRISFHGRYWLRRGNLFTGERPVVYRFDDLPPRRIMWDVNNRRGMLAERGEVESFLGHLMNAEHLVIRTLDIEEHRVDMTFRLVDVRRAVEQALAACGQREVGRS